ncbi:uracil-DNA glycosylase family protein [Campylobacter peloridis]|uniref:Uracil-DNA glycosylase family protein n=1 Tax=Campylobacter peloridis TaxID=488546 RepID=A0A5C7DJP1_9BACT|nr:uracil-DNA glycosylase family protein [Campylobacter peloridis]AJC84363.1 uracil-DNA glycosylase family protein [Campylobacter peloridis LMG 23910]MBX2078443.1 uracil-DNA glycosylase family protein [Campylobacter peloridis]QOQ88459.1 uracil-DNA glycosylase family protein [Campylobacter peloridis]TXE78885.1 uracil-DNA glycosylase family protein [Campylobacter peloridis]
MDKRKLHYLKAFGFEYIQENKHIFQIDFNYQELNEKIRTCSLCHFSKLRKKSLINNDVKKAKIIVYQAYIDKEENESGEFFASKLKQDFLKLCKEHLNLEKEDIYASYMLKCFSNFKTDDNALKLCLPYFYNELNFVNSKIILCLGKEAFFSLGFDNFERYKGEWLHFGECFVMPTYDLEFLSKNPSLFVEFIEDIKKIKGRL